MDDENARPEYSREPTIDDLVILCRHLNEAGVNYVVIGGFAIILNGYTRTTGDVDLLVDSTIENVDRIKQALIKPLPRLMPMKWRNIPWSEWRMKSLLT